MERIKIKNICEVNPKQEILDDNFIISFVGMAQISIDNQFDTTILKKYEDVKKGFSSFKDGDILFAKITPCMENGKGVLIENLYNGIGFGSTEFHVLRPNIKVVDKKYLYWFTMYKKFRLNCEKNMTGSAGQKRVPKNYIENYEIKLPKLIIQEKRVKILDTILKIKQEKLEQIKKLEELSKSIFIEMFKENHDKVSWEYKKIIEVYQIIDGDRGKNYPKSEELFEKEYCLFLNTGNVTKNGFNFEKKVFITKEKDEILKNGKLERNDIVLTTRGTIGNIAYYDNTIEYSDIRINSGMVILRKIKEINPYYFMAFFKEENTYMKLVSGSAQPQMPISKLKEFKLLLPPIELQNNFAEIIRKIEKSKFLCTIF